MYNIHKLCIIGMGPAGIGLALSLQGNPMIKDTICFEQVNI